MSGNNGTDSAIRIARPTLRIAGQDKPRLSEGLLTLLIAENTSGLYRCEATFGNLGPVDRGTGFLYFDRQLLEFGKAFAVKLGTDTLFDGRIMGLEAHFPEGQPPELNVLAEDRFQDLRMTRRSRTFSDMSDADVFNQIANDHGLSPSVDVSGGAPSGSHKVLAQVNQSDLAFLRERARVIDAELWMDGSTLYVKTHGNRNGGSVRLSHGKNLREFTVLADLAGQRTAVAVNGWDVASKKGLHQEATEQAISNELGSTTSGVSILAATLGERKEALDHLMPLTSEEADAAAAAAFRLMARRFVVGHGVADPSSALRVGSTAELDGLGPLFNGKYYVTEVRNIFDSAGGLRTAFTVERPGLGQPR